MTILLTNDDGIESEGVHLLAQELCKIAPVLVVVPDRERSGQSHSLTIGSPVQYKKRHESDELCIYEAKATPADCVRLGLEKLDPSAGLVVSGINAGANVGLNIHYSGTVAAALEAAFGGRMGLAVSIASRAPKNFPGAASLAARLVRMMLESDDKPAEPSPPQVLNLNFPDLPPDRIRGILITREATTEKETALVANDSSVVPDEFEADDIVLDSRAVAAGFASLTPLKIDLTDYGRLEALKRWSKTWAQMEEKQKTT